MQLHCARCLPQAASASEKEELQKQVVEARAACETHLKSLQEAQATAANEAKSLHDKATALTADLEAAKVCYLLDVIEGNALPIFF